ncbi:family 43 glycosylhydrolase [Mucilaginibacter sp. CSA2-8R]|uniref:family 43 glycosylhydrolase n=1 Tax=Mucilaginibacter sp. CSA2-8R TaxID=3141542 RepID=UPI00315CCB80
MPFKLIIYFLLASTLFTNLCKAQSHAQVSYSGNPILPGDFADPCVLFYQDTVYIYATAANVGSVWRSADMVNWKLTLLNWPTAMHLPDVWAPAVRQGTNGQFYLYTTVNHQIYAGVSNHPLGPFHNILGDGAFIKDRQYWDKIHSIDADCFIDDDGQAYLYWGSGWDFKDAVCAVGVLNKDMASFKDAPQAVTPKGYFEGPHMLKRNHKYYLMYSDGVYFNDSYKVRYAIGNTPTGPFEQAVNSPILTSDAVKHVSGPGHHFTFCKNGQYYIVYQKHTYPYRNGQRQVCIDKLDFDAQGLIKQVNPTSTGVPLTFLKHKNTRKVIKPVSVQASGMENMDYVPDNATDHNFGTRWLAPAGQAAFLQADLGQATTIKGVEPIFDDIMGAYDYRIEYSKDQKNWMPFATGQNARMTEWPVEHKKMVKARYIRISIAQNNGRQAGLWEFNIYQ